jgi:hypothetical protein
MEVDMKKYVLGALVLATPLCAQSWELGVFAGQQTYKSAEFMGVSAEPKSKTVFGARLGYSVVDMGPALFQVTAGFQPKAESEIEVGSVNTGEKFQSQHMSVGAMFNFKAMVAFGAGLEYRFEKLNITNSGISDVSYGRPWLRANAGYAFPTPIVKPFIGLEVALPLMSKSFDVNASDSDNTKALAPKLQIGVYGGIRF